MALKLHHRSEIASKAGGSGVIRSLPPGDRAKILCMVAKELGREGLRTRFLEAYLEEKLHMVRPGIDTLRRYDFSYRIKPIIRKADSSGLKDVANKARVLVLEAYFTWVVQEDKPSAIKVLEFGANSNMPNLKEEMGADIRAVVEAALPSLICPEQDSATNRAMQDNPKRYFTLIRELAERAGLEPEKSEKAAEQGVMNLAGRTDPFSYTCHREALDVLPVPRLNEAYSYVQEIIETDDTML